MTSIGSEQAAAASDLDAIFRLYYQELNRFAYRRLGDREAAADVVQDAFVRYIASDFHQQDAPSSASSRFFLLRIVSNLMIDVARRDRRRGFHANLEDMSEHLVDPAPTADRLLESREDFLQVKRTLDALPAKCRAALLLNRIEGLTHAQIAQRLEVSPSMVSKYIITALRRCVNSLAELHG
ncbi:sigma-70 family RNA polymerase sigma factor [Azorhizobium sp. AG788]|uniref:RNA polymerase sigma factor n=1 Tax=Azorhizobium sp. AG788 TaxID=2183897 RepID=UPI0031398676